MHNRSRHGMHCEFDDLRSMSYASIQTLESRFKIVNPASNSTAVSDVTCCQDVFRVIHFKVEKSKMQPCFEKPNQFTVMEC